MAPLGRQGPALSADLAKQALGGKSGQDVSNLVDPIAGNPSDGAGLRGRAAAKRERLQHGVLDGWKHRGRDRAIPPAVLPSVEHAVLESFPLGSSPAPETSAIARISGYRIDQVRHVLARLAAEGLLGEVGAQRWTLTSKGRHLRTMIRSGSD